MLGTSGKIKLFDARATRCDLERLTVEVKYIRHRMLASFRISCLGGGRGSGGTGGLINS